MYVYIYIYILIYIPMCVYEYSLSCPRALSLTLSILHVRARCLSVFFRPFLHSPSHTIPARRGEPGRHYA